MVQKTEDAGLSESISESVKPEKPSQESVEADSKPEQPREIGGRGGLDPTRYGDWEKAGRCIDF
jgi:hypothetical protein